MRLLKTVAKRLKGPRDVSCGLYALDGTAIVLPRFGIKPSADHAVTAPLEAAALGRVVLEAMGTSPPKSLPNDLKSLMAAVEARMEAFRLEIGAGKQRLMRDLQHVSAYREDGALKIRQFRAVHGRLAFEGTGRDVILTGDAQDDPQAVGAAVLELLEV